METFRLWLQGTHTYAVPPLDLDGNPSYGGEIVVRDLLIELEKMGIIVDLCAAVGSIPPETGEFYPMICSHGTHIPWFFDEEQAAWERFNKQITACDCVNDFSHTSQVHEIMMKNGLHCAVDVLWGSCWSHPRPPENIIVNSEAQRQMGIKGETGYEGSEFEHMGGYSGSIPDARVVHLGVNTDKYAFCDEKEDYFVWLSRFHPCLLGSQQIQTRDGFRDIRDVSVGDMVYTHKGTFAKVEQKHIRDYEDDIITIRPYLIPFPFQLTPEHPILAAKRIKCLKGGNRNCKPPGTKGCGQCKKWRKYSPDWIPAGSLEERDFLLLPYPREKDYSTIRISDHIDVIVNNGLAQYPRKTKPCNAICDTIPLTEDFMRLCGYFLSEGSCRRHTIAFTFGPSEKILAADCVQIASQFGWKAKVHNKKTTLSVMIHSLVLAQLFRTLFGRCSYEKKIPPLVLGLSKSKLIQLLKGMFLGDGYFNSRFLSYASNSKTLILQLILILARLGVPSSIKAGSNCNTAFGGRDIYELTIRGKGSWLSPMIFGKEMEKRRWTRSLGTVHDGFLWIPIRAITRGHYQGKVYNLKVSDAESYVTESATCHNCKGIFHLINMLKDRPDLKFKIVGNVSKTITEHRFYAQQVLQHAANLPNLEIVNLDDYNDREKTKIECFQRAKAFVYPLQYHESFGLVMAESLSCGTPVVAYNRGSVPEIIKQGYNGFYADLNDVETFMRYVDLVDEIRPRDCRESVEKNFSREVMARNYVKLYREVMDGGRWGWGA